MGNAWLPEHDALIRSIYEKGGSARSVMDALKEHHGFIVTRNAVIGRSNRMGIKQDKKRSDKRVLAGMAIKKKIAVAKPQPIPAPKPEPKKEKGLPLLALGSRHCRWAIKEREQGDFLFCADTTRAGSPYCEHHHGLAYYKARPQLKEAKPLWR